MSEKSQQIIMEYVAGASLAFGFVVLFHEGLGVFYSWVGADLETVSGELLFVLFTTIHIIGGFMSGYLVCRRSEEKALRAGVITAILSYVIEFVYNIIFVGSFGGNLLALISLLVGSVSGAVFASRVHRLF